MQLITDSVQEEHGFYKITENYFSCKGAVKKVAFLFVYFHNSFHNSLLNFFSQSAKYGWTNLYFYGRNVYQRDLNNNSHLIHEYHTLFTIFQDFFIIQVYKNISSITIRLHSNIGKIICKNVNILIYSQNFGNFETYFFLNLYLQIFLVKQRSSKNYSFYGLPL